MHLVVGVGSGATHPLLAKAVGGVSLQMLYWKEQMQKACTWTEAVKSACVPVQVVLTNFELRKHQEIPIVVGVKYYHCYLTITAYNKCYLLATSDARSMRLHFLSAFNQLSIGINFW